MGTNLDSWCLDRRGIKGRDGQDQWHGSLLGALGIQGIRNLACLRVSTCSKLCIGYQESDAAAIGA